MKVRTLPELLRENLIVKHYAGSHAYGTALPTSDVDFRGIFAADPVNIRTPFFPVYEVDDPTEEDTKFYELSKFMKLYTEGNPNIVETLWVDPTDIVSSTSTYDLLRLYRQALLSAKLAFTTTGYATAQLKRIKGHNKWITNPQPIEPPKPFEFLSVLLWSNKELHERPDVRDYLNDHRLIPYGNEIYGIFPEEGRTLWDDKGNLNDIFEGRLDDVDLPLFMVKWNKQEYRLRKEKHEQYWTWKNNRNKTRAELEEDFGFDCYTDDTEFLTDSGWKLFDDVTEFDKIATFHPQTHKVEYQLPQERIDSTYTGNVYNLTGYRVDTNVSANHWMYIREHSRTTGITDPSWKLVRVAELPETFDTLNVIVPKKNRQRLPEGVNEKIFNHLCLLDYLRLVGWYISDGTANFYPSGSVKHIMISQSKPQSKLTQTLTKQINSEKIKCSSYIFEKRGMSNYPERRWTFDAELSQLVYDDCGHKSEHKRLPPWCFFLTKREMTTLLISLLQGDGTKRNHQKHTYAYYTVNSALADDVQRLALLCGFETSKYGPYEINSTFQTENKMYQVHINMRPSKHRRHVRSASIQKTLVEKQRIVCFMVKNHTLITRRNGQVGLHGNTKHAMHLVRLMRMGVEALQDGVIIVKRPDAEELLSIRNGAWSYEQLIEYAEHMDYEIREVYYAKTFLPKYPDVELAAKVLLEAQDMIWSKNNE